MKSQKSRLEAVGALRSVQPRRQKSLFLSVVLNVRLPGRDTRVAFWGILFWRQDRKIREGVKGTLGRDILVGGGSIRTVGEYFPTFMCAEVCFCQQIRVVAVEITWVYELPSRWIVNRLAIDKHTPYVFPWLVSRLVSHASYNDGRLGLAMLSPPFFQGKDQSNSHMEHHYQY